jgi:hypothetical protein
MEQVRPSQNSQYAPRTVFRVIGGQLTLFERTFQKASINLRRPEAIARDDALGFSKVTPCLTREPSMQEEDEAHRTQSVLDMRSPLGLESTLTL